MTHVYPAPTTFCEVTYDSDWFDDDRHVTPYRYSLLRSDEDSNSDTVSLTLPSYTYYEYLRSLYDCRTAPTPRYPLGYTAPSLASNSVGDGPPRATTWHSFNKDTNSEFSRQALRSEPTRIRPTYPFPTLHLIQQGESGDECDDDIAVDRTKQKLIWVDALNKWVPESQLHPKPYLSFVGNVPCVEKPGKYPPKELEGLCWSAPSSRAESRRYMSLSSSMELCHSPVLYGGGEGGAEPHRTCDRFQAHMGRSTGASLPHDRTHCTCQRRTVGQNNERRDAARKKALELAEQRKQRKAYSTPLYTSMAERQQKVRVQSSKFPLSTPVSPTSHHRQQQQHQQQQQSQHQLLPSLQQPKERVPVPREAWLPGEGRKDRSRPGSAKSTTTSRREISITLMTPNPPEDQDKFEDDVSVKSDKKVTFQTEGHLEQKANLKKETKDDEDEVDSSLNRKKSNNDTYTEDQLKARQREAEERARLQELSRQESSSREGTLNSGLHRSASSRDNEYKENVYENTMNAAELLLSHENSVEEIKPPKPEVNIEKSVKLPSASPKPQTCLRPASKRTSKPESKKTIMNRPESKKAFRPTVANKTKLAKIDNKTLAKNIINNKEKIDISLGENKEVKEATIKVAKKESVLKVANNTDNSNVKIIEKVEVNKEVEMLPDVENKPHAKRRNKGKSDASKQKGKSKGDKPEKTKKGRKEPQDREEVKAPPPPTPPQPPPKPKDKPKEKPLKAKPIQDKDVKPAKPSKPMLVGMRQATKPPSAMAPNTIKSKTGALSRASAFSSGRWRKSASTFASGRWWKSEKLPITRPSELELDKTQDPETEPESESETQVVKPQSPSQARRKNILEQRQIIKKEKRERRLCDRKNDAEEDPKRLPDISGDVKRVDSWIYGQDDFTTQSPDREQDRVPNATEPLPAICADLSPEFIEKKKEQKEKSRKSKLASLIAIDHAAVKLRKPGQKDSSYQDELRRLELAEERRKKQMEMYERLKKGKLGIFGDMEDDGTTRFEDYGFLSRYCIFNQGNIDMYKHAFDAVDENGEGWLEGQDVMIALRGANNRLTEAEEEYLYRVLELTGYQITHGADFKMFSVLAALSQKISSLDKWMKNMIGKMDFKQLEMKMFKCKELWDCNVDKETNTMSVDDLCVELRAGGVSFEHEMEVRNKLTHMPNLDLLDFLSYVPLFIMIHEAVVENPLDDTRTK